MQKKKAKIIHRESGYYWVRIKRTGRWIIAKWMESYQSWDYITVIRDDDRSGFDKVYEHKLEPPKIKIKRTRRNESTKNGKGRKRRTRLR